MTAAPAIVIPTHLRPEGKTYRFFRELNPYVIVHTSHSIPIDCPPDRVLVQPQTSIRASRQAALEHFDTCIMLDDDLDFSWGPLAMRTGKPTPADVIGEIILWLGFTPLVGVADRAFCNGNPPIFRVRGPLRHVFGMDCEALRAAGVSWESELTEDVRFVYDAIAAGIQAVTITDIVQQDKPGRDNPGNPTGCNAWRTDDKIQADVEHMALKYPGFVDPQKRAFFVERWRKHNGLSSRSFRDEALNYYQETHGE